MGPQKGETHEEHIAQHQELVQQVLERLKTNNLHLNPKKCVFEQDHLNFLGVHIVKGVV